MTPVTGIDDRGIDMAGKQQAGAGALMPHNKNVRVHGIQRDRRIKQAFTLLIEDVDTGTLTTEAPILRAARSNETRVRVEFSKNRLKTVMPLR